MRIARSLTVILLWLAFIASPAAAETFSQDLSGLAEKSFKRKLGAINAVALSGHERAQAVLVALSKGRLFVANPGKRLVIAKVTMEINSRVRWSCCLRSCSRLMIWA